MLAVNITEKLKIATGFSLKLWDNNLSKREIRLIFNLWRNKPNKTSEKMNRLFGDRREREREHAGWL